MADPQFFKQEGAEIAKATSRLDALDIELRALDVAMGRIGIAGVSGPCRSRGPRWCTDFSRLRCAFEST